jgi:hypothetical protein
MSLFNEEPWHLAFRWKGRRYRRSCKNSLQPEAKKVKALVLAAVTGRRSVALPGGLATPGVHIHRRYEARSHHGR